MGSQDRSCRLLHYRRGNALVWRLEDLSIRLSPCVRCTDLRSPGMISVHIFIIHSEKCYKKDTIPELWIHKVFCVVTSPVRSVWCATLLVYAYDHWSFYCTTYTIFIFLTQNYAPYANHNEAINRRYRWPSLVVTQLSQHQNSVVSTCACSTCFAIETKVNLKLTRCFAQEAQALSHPGSGF